MAAKSSGGASFTAPVIWDPEYLMQQADEKMSSLRSSGGTNVQRLDIMAMYEKVGDKYTRVRKHRDAKKAAMAYQKAIETYDSQSSQGTKENRVELIRLGPKIVDSRLTTDTAESAETFFRERVLPVLAEDDRNVDIGRMYERIIKKHIEEENIDRAVELFDIAMQYYEEAGQINGQRSIKAEHATLVAQRAPNAGGREAVVAKFAEAADLFKECGDICLEDPIRLLRYHSPKYYVSSILCALAAEEIVTAKERLEMADNECESFKSSGERHLCMKVIEAVEAMKPELVGAAWAQHAIQMTGINETVLRYLRDHLQTFSQDDNPESAEAAEDSDDHENPSLET
eukprot:gb/GECG01002640.1/.p1 GENE.gb/GECG01002640.1/~~gb/GECG01002640.1/.p1  ORF type:complete len:343 (+),score=46.15 gb/GECG01002640.1/:1-1029(+)